MVVFYSSNSCANTFLISFLCVVCLFSGMNVATLLAVEGWLCVVPSSLIFLLQLLFLFPFLDSILIFNYGSVIVPVGKHLLVPTHLFICSFVQIPCGLCYILLTLNFLVAFWWFSTLRVTQGSEILVVS